MLQSIYTKIAQVLGSENFGTSYVFSNQKYESRLNSRFGIVDVLSNKAIGKATANDGTLFEEYELEVKITLYFKQDENTFGIQPTLDSLFQRFYRNTQLNVTSIFSKPVRYTSVYKCLQGEIILNISYLTEVTS